MGQRIHIEESGNVPEDAIVLHYDELDAELKHSLPSLIEQPPSGECSLPECDTSDEFYVKFTDYYRLTCQ